MPPGGNLVGLIAELIVLGCIACGIAANSALIGTCKMLKLGRNAGYIGPWRADIYGMTDGCVGWNKDETDLDDWILNMARLQYDGTLLRLHSGLFWIHESMLVSIAVYTKDSRHFRGWRSVELGVNMAHGSHGRL
jgi:hypothetical protein